jgi:hypothetical protein
MPPTNLDDEWIQKVVKAGKMEESFLAKESCLKGTKISPKSERATLKRVRKGLLVEVARKEEHSTKG